MIVVKIEEGSGNVFANDARPTFVAVADELAHKRSEAFFDRVLA